MSFVEIEEKAVSFLGKKSFLLAGFLGLILLAAIIFLIPKNSKITPQPDKTWEINLTYNSSSKKLSLEKLTVVNRKTVPDQRNALYSPYKLQVLGKNGNVVFTEKVNITEKILYDILLNAPEGRVLVSADIKSVIFIPYQADGAKIVILRNSSTVLQINLPKTTVSSFIQSAEALTQPSISCGPITTVFINDNYTNTTQFKSDVAYLKNLYNTTPPYNITPSIFDFKEVDAPQGFGCANSGITSCMNNLQVAIKNSALRYFPNAQKFIVLVDNPNALTVDGGVAGLVNGIGGDVIIYTNYAYADAGPVSGQPFAAAAHEFEGHALGYLWDRYVSSDTSYAAIAPGDVMSNCSTNPQGEVFWKNSGSTGAFAGCGNQNQYAPFALTCQSSRKDLVSGGTNSTIMSAIGCSTNEFDQVEQVWITNNILPNYKACPTGAVVNVIPSTTINFTPTPQTVTVNDTVNLDVMLNPGTNQVDFAQLVINYDPSKLSVVPAGPAICPAKPEDAFCPNVLAFPVILQGPIYTSGTISVTLSIGGGPTSVIQTSAKIGTLTFKAIAPTGASPTQVTVNVPQSQALSIASTDYFNQNVLSSASPAVINITGVSSPTPTPTASPAPTASPTLSPSPIPNSAPTYNCVLDPATCDSGKSSIQMCVLKCTPN
ncbi:MAG: cohesin domain-containing protein [Patescibacteria group bacterium]|nr:cohesin domain-containing protein [Patescibacteria group bacterium]